MMYLIELRLEALFRRLHGLHRSLELTERALLGSVVPLDTVKLLLVQPHVRLHLVEDVLRL